MCNETCDLCEPKCDLCEENSGGSGRFYLNGLHGGPVEVEPYATDKTEYWDNKRGGDYGVVGYSGVSVHDAQHLRETAETSFEVMWPVSLIAWEE